MLRWFCKVGEGPAVSLDVLRRTREAAFDSEFKNPSLPAIEDLKRLNQKSRGELVDFLLRKLQDFGRGSRTPFNQYYVKQIIQRVSTNEKDRVKEFLRESDIGKRNANGSLGPLVLLAALIGVFRVALMLAHALATVLRIHGSRAATTQANDERQQGANQDATQPFPFCLLRWSIFSRKHDERKLALRHRDSQFHIPHEVHSWRSTTLIPYDLPRTPLRHLLPLLMKSLSWVPTV
jgi:hypothetical protein